MIDSYKNGLHGHLSFFNFGVLTMKYPRVDHLNEEVYYILYEWNNIIM